MMFSFTKLYLWHVQTFKFKKLRYSSFNVFFQIKRPVQKTPSNSSCNQQNDSIIINPFFCEHYRDRDALYKIWKYDLTYTLEFVCSVVIYWPPLWTKSVYKEDTKKIWPIISKYNNVIRLTVKTEFRKWDIEIQLRSVATSQNNCPWE